MFHHYSENSSSTGEPPTLSPDNHSLISEQIVPTGNMNQEETIQMSLPSNSESSRSLSGQEPDSGYEASPSSLADNPGSFHFFGEQSMAVTNQIIHPHSSRQYSDEELELLNCQYPVLHCESESDMEDWDTCPDCHLSANCDCDRTDSSTTYVTTAISNCDNNSSSRSNSSDLSSNRPSSQPIEIPVLRSYRIRSDSVVIDPRIDLRLQPARSQPLDFNRITAVGFASDSHAVSSWPSTIPTWRIQRNIALPIFLETLSSRYIIPRTNRLRRSNRRVSRRQIIDSDASSVNSSDDDGPEDVFNMAGEEASPFSPVLANGSLPLPDVVVLQSSDSTRRNRSFSINLPPDPAMLQSIGQTLRRLSDQFESRREIMAARGSRRRQTIGSISDLDDDHS